MKTILPLSLCLLAVLGSCGQDKPPEGAAVRDRDHQALAVSRGVSKLISDSGIVRYRFIAEEWVIYDRTDPPRQDFMNGVLILRYDDQQHIDMQVTADTAYCYDQYLWDLRGRVYINDESGGTTYRAERLLWDMHQHEFWADVPMHIVTPDREVRGTHFRANEQMTRYEVTDDRGYMPMPKAEKEDTEQKTDSTKTAGAK